MDTSESVTVDVSDTFIRYTTRGATPVIALDDGTSTTPINLNFCNIDPHGCTRIADNSGYIPRSLVGKTLIFYSEDGERVLERITIGNYSESTGSPCTSYPSCSASITGAFFGGLVLGMFILLGVLALIYFCYKKKRQAVSAVNKHQLMQRCIDYLKCSRIPEECNEMISVFRYNVAKFGVIQDIVLTPNCISPSLRNLDISSLGIPVFMFYVVLPETVPNENITLIDIVEPLWVNKVYEDLLTLTQPKIVSTSVNTDNHEFLGRHTGKTSTDRTEPQSIGASQQQTNCETNDGKKTSDDMTGQGNRNSELPITAPDVANETTLLVTPSVPETDRNGSTATTAANVYQQEEKKQDKNE